MISIASMRLRPFIPNALTFLAMLCGLSAIFFCGRGQFLFASLAILLAAALDTADGFAARRLSAESEVGAELDTLADFLNFGVAPAFLIHNRDLTVLGFWAWCVSAIYVMAAGFRLARFNVLRRQRDKPAGVYQGVPSTAAAAALVIASTVAQLSSSKVTVAELVAGLSLILSGLMVSKLAVPSLRVLLKKQGKSGR